MLPNRYSLYKAKDMIVCFDSLKREWFCSVNLTESHTFFFVFKPSVSNTLLLGVVKTSQTVGISLCLEATAAPHSTMVVAEETRTTLRLLNNAMQFALDQESV